MENILTAVKFNEICRVCLMEGDSLFSIYSELFEDNSAEETPSVFTITICEILLKISSIKVQSEDGLPTMICTKCMGKAHSSYKFQQLCDRSQSLLEAYIKGLATTEDKPIEEPVYISEDNYSDLNPKYDLKHDIQNVNEDVIENDDLPPELVSINENDLIKGDILIDSEDSALNICIPFGEDTVDEFIKDFDLNSPKLGAFNLNLVDKDDIDKEKPVTPSVNNVKKVKKITKTRLSKMKYYRKKRDDGTIEYECNVCQEKCESRKNLKIHLQDHNKEKPYVCGDCKKCFKDYGTLKQHIFSHTGEQPYECEVCRKRFKQSSNVLFHMRIHTGDKQYLCSTCGLKFTRSSDLNYHTRTHTQEKPYMCNVCGKTMSMKCHLTQHMRSHTGEKPFKCSANDCEKAFSSPSELRRHSVVHTNKKSYTCETCMKSFNRSSTLKAHQKVHQNIRPHVCEICNKTFTWAHSLRDHKQRHANEIFDEASPATAVEDTTNTTQPTVSATTTAPPTETASLEFNPLKYADSLLDKSANESFTIYPSGGFNDANSSETFQIYSVGPTGNQNKIETFTLYSVDMTSISPLLH